MELLEVRIIGYKVMAKTEKILRFVGIFKYFGHNFMANGPIFKIYMSKCSIDPKELNDINLMRFYRDLLFLWPDIARGAQFSVHLETKNKFKNLLFWSDDISRVVCTFSHCLGQSRISRLKVNVTNYTVSTKTRHTDHQSASHCIPCPARRKQCIWRHRPKCLRDTKGRNFC